MLLVLGCFTSFVYAFGENSFITHLVLSPKRLAFLGTPCSATMLLTDGVTGSSHINGLEGRAAQSNSPVDCCDRERPSARSRANRVLFGAPYEKP